MLLTNVSLQGHPAICFKRFPWQNSYGSNQTLIVYILFQLLLVVGVLGVLGQPVVVIVFVISVDLAVTQSLLMVGRYVEDRIMT